MLRTLAPAILLLLLCAACSAPAGTTPAAVSEGTPVPAPAAGKATVMGRIQDSRTGQPMGNTTVRLAEVYRGQGEGAYVLDGGRSPSALTNEAGEFVIADIDAREYVLVVGDLLGAYVVIAEPTGVAKTWGTESGKVLNVGVVAVDLQAEAAKP